MASTINDVSWTVICDRDIFKRCGFACGVYQDRYIVIAGGFKHSMDIQSAAMYDVVNQSWIALPILLDGGDDCHGVVLNGYFYVAESNSKLHRICLLRRMEWEFVAKGKCLEIHGMVTDGNQIFLIDLNKQIISFDPINDEFIPVGRGRGMNVMRSNDFSSVLVNNKIYAMGGYSNSYKTENTYLFDIVTESWSLTTPLPVPLARFSAVVIDRWIFVTGMDDYDDPIQVVYDTQSQVWTQSNTAVLSPHIGHRMVKVGSQIITLGGWDPDYFGYCPMAAIHIKHIIPDWKWFILKPYILLRQLIVDDRASPVKATSKRTHADSDLNEEAVIEKLFTNMQLDMFRYILLFL